MIKAVSARYLLWAAYRLATAAKLALFARMIEPSVIGAWVTALSVVALAVAAGNFGIRENVLLRGDVGGGRLDGAFGAALWACAFSILLGALLICPLGALLLGESLNLPLAMGLLLNCLLPLATFSMLRAESVGKVHWVQIPQLVSELVCLVFVAAMLHAGVAALHALYASAAAGVLAAAAATLLLCGAPPRPRLRVADIVPYRQYGFPVATYSLISALTVSAIPFALARFHDVGQVALFWCASSVSALIYGVLSVLENSYYPLFAKRSSNQVELNRIFIESSYFFAVIGYLVAGLLFCLSGYLAHTVFGLRWDGLEDLFKILSIQVAVRVSTAYLYGHLVFASAHTKVMVRWALLDLFLVATLGLFMVHSFGVQGAIAYQILQGVILIPVVRFPAIRGALGDLSVYRHLWKPAAAFFACLLPMALTSPSTTGEAFFDAGVFLASFLILLALLDRDFHTLMHRIKNGDLA